MFHLSYENAQYHQTISEVKSQFRALASSTFPNIVKLLKQRESIWIMFVRCSYFDKIVYLF